MKLTINLATASYPIIIESALRYQIKTRLIQMGCNKIAIVTDATVWALYGELMRAELEDFEYELTVFSPGENAKSHENLMVLYRNWLDFDLSRKDMVIAFGGGVIGDLTGYAAVNFMRGVPFIQIPTTLLSQVDSSIGGKVAVNLPEGKNLIGTFYHPNEVWIDTDFLQSLPERVFKDGMAEVVKAGCIMDRNLYQLLIDSEYPLGSSMLYEIIERALIVKKHLVENDEKEMGVRKILNFGHTIGHALESYGAYSRWTHGEAVAMGMVWVTKSAEGNGLVQKGTTDDLKALLHKIGLPTESGVALEELMQWLVRDKKKTSRGIELSIMHQPGESFLHEVPKEDLYRFLSV
ncbi:MAG: 3-dehydroquinate synthase [Clostridiales bacterium 38-18]|nr:MAG: 3-dehydroquinate synthase [Clostridiales bacterium 38-18]